MKLYGKEVIRLDGINCTIPKKCRSSRFMNTYNINKCCICGVEGNTIGKCKSPDSDKIHLNIYHKDGKGKYILLSYIDKKENVYCQNCIAEAAKTPKQMPDHPISLFDYVNQILDENKYKELIKRLGGVDKIKELSYTNKNHENRKIISIAKRLCSMVYGTSKQYWLDMYNNYKEYLKEINMEDQKDCDTCVNNMCLGCTNDQKQLCNGIEELPFCCSLPNECEECTNTKKFKNYNGVKKEIY